MAEIKKIDVIGHITNNLVKGICTGKTLVALQGSARSGKTYQCMIMLIQCCINPQFANNLYKMNWMSKCKDEDWAHKLTKDELEDKKRTLSKKLARTSIHVSIIRLSMPSLKRSVFQDFKDIMLSMGVYDDRRMNKTEMVYTFENGSVMEFFATADNEQKVRGSKRDIGFCNEGNELSEWEFTQLRMRTEDFMLVDFNPSFTEEHWLFKIINEPRTYHFISTFMDNPFLTDSIKDEILSYKFTNPALWQIFGCGEFAIVKGLVYPKETWDKVKVEDLPIGVKMQKRMGIDVGFSGKGDPTAVTLCYFCTIQGIKHLYMQEIIYESGLNEKQLAYRLKPYNDVPKYIDSANPLYIQNLEDNGVQMIYPVKKYANSVVDGITKVQGYKLHVIFPSTNIVKELSNYCWMKDRHGSYTNQPIDKFNHGMDSIRYACMPDRTGRFGNLKRRYTKEELGL